IRGVSYLSAIQITVSGTQTSFRIEPGTTLKQQWIILKENRDLSGSLKDGEKPLVDDDNHFLAMVQDLGGPLPKRQQKAWWEGVFIPTWNPAYPEHPYDDWHEPYQRDNRLREKAEQALQRQRTAQQGLSGVKKENGA
ncbi:MAG: hypothetical protein ACREOH_07385, partial [Candidatus Entotheonellia bacterium]